MSGTSRNTVYYGYSLFIGLMGRVFANCPGDLGSIPCGSFKNFLTVKKG